MNPYLILQVPLTASDGEIRQAYLNAIRASPPESDPARFQQVREAYDSIKDECARIRWQLFHSAPPASSPVEVLVQYVALPGRTKPVDSVTLKNWLRACARPS